MARLVLFGPAREAARRSEDEIGGETVGDVLDRAVARYGAAFAEVLAASRVWVNGDAADRGVAVSAYDEVCVVPPVSGG